MKIKWRYVIIVAIILIVFFNSCGKSGSDTGGSTKAAETSQVNTDSQSSDPDAQAEKLESIKNVKLSKGLAKLKEFGFTPTFYVANSDKDITDLIDTSDKELVKEYTITEVSASGADKTADVYIASKGDLKNMKTEEKLTKKLDSGSAWVAAENYGEAAYPYGFKLHYLTGQIAQEAESKNTWYLKAECTVTNEYGAKQKGTCEAEVTGTTESPEVTAFNVN